MRKAILLSLLSTLHAGAMAQASEAKKEENQSQEQGQKGEEGCTKPLQGPACVGLLPAPQDLPKAIEVESFRSYVGRLLTLEEPTRSLGHKLVVLKSIALDPAGQRYLDRALKASNEVSFEISEALKSTHSFQDAQYHGSQASLVASRVSNSLAEIRLYVTATQDADKIFSEIERQMQTYDELSQALMPTWLK